MKSLLPFTILVLLVTSFVSCRKDPKPDGPINPTVNSITFGDYEGMDVKTFDSIEWEYYDDIFLTYYQGGCFILDDDENCSFGLCSRVETIFDQSTKDQCVIEVLSTDLQFQYETVLNHVYEHIDTIILQTDSIPSIYVDGLLTCYKIDDSDQIIQTNYYTHWITHSTNEVLSMDSPFMISPTASNCLFMSNLEYPTEVIETPEATIYQNWVDASEECYFAPLKEEFYLGFKYSSESRNRLGWVKLIIEPNDNCMYRIRPLEVAIQK